MNNDYSKIVSLRMERQFLTRQADMDEYITLYRDMQPGLNVYWNGFGQPPVLSFRADFDDIEFNRERLADRRLIKGRFTSGNLGWVMQPELELYAALYIKPIASPDISQMQMLELIKNEGPMTIHDIKQKAGLLVKAITPILHRLQEAFLIYEDQCSGEWDRSWHMFSEMFPQVNLQRYTRAEALKIVLERFAYRHVLFDLAMAKSFYKLPEKEIKAALSQMTDEGVLIESDDGFMLASDVAVLEKYQPVPLHFVYAMHKNDFFVKSNEHILKDMFAYLYDELEYDHEPLQFLLIDGEFHGACVGHFRNGPYDLNDVVCDLPDADLRRDEILFSISQVNFGSTPQRFMGQKI